MISEYHTLGEKLRGKRQELGLSLKEVENSTSIRTSFLEAIENGKGDQLIASIYSTGFIRQYVNFLGLNVDEVMKEFPQVFTRQEQKHDFAYGIGTLEMRGSLGGGVKWISPLLKALTFVGVGFGLFFIAKYMGLFG